MRSGSSRPSNLGMRKQAVLFALTFVLALFPGSARARVSFEALQQDGYGMVELVRPEPNTLMVKATINGRKARLIVDTGWSDEGITIKPNYGKVLNSPIRAVKGFGLSASGRSVGSFQEGEADSVIMGNVIMRNVPVIFGALGSLQLSYSRSNVQADGFIGSGFLRTCSAIIDLHNLRLYLRPPGTGRRAVISSAMKGQGLAEVPFSIVDSHCFVDVEVNGVAGSMFVDTGASLAEVDEHFAKLMKARAYSSRVVMVDAAGVETPTKLTQLRSFKIGGVEVRAPDLRIGQLAFYQLTHGEVVGLLGMDILGKNGTIIDFGQKKLYFYPYF